MNPKEALVPKAIFVLLGLLLLTALACNLPVSTVRATPDEIGTQVAQTLTQYALQPTITPPYTPPIHETPLPSPSPTPEILPTSTPTTAEDPRAHLGDPIYVDTLDSGRSFGLEGKIYEDENTLIRVQSGSMILTSKYATGYHGWRTGGRKIQNGYVEGLFRTGDCAGQDTYGLIVRSPDFIRGYWFTLTCDGQYGFGYWDGEKYVNLLTQKDDRLILRTGPEQTNRLGVWMEDNTFRLFANGSFLSEISNAQFLAEGYTGAVIAAHNTPGFTVFLDEIAYWNLP